MPIPAAGGAVLRTGSIAIRFAYHGCTNRPFYHVVIQNRFMDREDQCIEQIGTYDPLPNADNQKLLGLNIERLQYWLGRGAEPTRPVARVLGLVGLLPIHHETVVAAWRNRKKMAEEKAKLDAEAASSNATEANSSSN